MTVSGLKAVRVVLAMAALALGSCGGGGSDKGSSPPTNNPPASNWVQGVFQPASGFISKCVAPRSGSSPVTGRPYPDTPGARLDENNWLRSWTNETYLWYSEVLDRDPASYTTAEYFDFLKTNQPGPATGVDKDQYHYRIPTAEYESLALGGVDAGYGVYWAVVRSLPPRRVVVAYTEPDSPAADAPASLLRGVEVLTIDGIDVANDNTQAGVDAILDGLYPGALNKTHTFVLRDPGASSTRTVTLTSASVTVSPVQKVTTLDTGTGIVGYMLFNDHMRTSEAALVEAIQTLKNAGVTDLALDLRYNGGGFLDIAAELAYMIAGPVPTAGRTFELTKFNNKHPVTDPVTGRAITPTPFFSTAQGFSVAEGQPLPTLNLSRVYILTGDDTCSASESIINGFRGIDFEVYIIGNSTCGKPYGFYATDNCGTTYMSIQMQGVNHKGFGDYMLGFEPSNMEFTYGGVRVPGCSVGDDFSYPLGNRNEAMLDAVLRHRTGNGCPGVSGHATNVRPLSVSGEWGLELKSRRHFLRENRILGR